MFRRALFLTTLALIFAMFALAQDKSKRPSPPAQAKCQLAGGKSVAIDYSSPRMNRRKIFGDLVPYGEVWRTGANEATTFVTTANLTVGGTSVPAGNYTIFTVPNQTKWTLIINKKTGEWGIPYKYDADELARVDMKVAPTMSPVENFTIALDQKGGSCTLKMSWESTQASVEIAEAQ